MECGIRLIGNGQAPVYLYWHDILQIIRDGKTDPLAMLSHPVKLEEMEEVYHIFDNWGDNMQKIFVQTKWSNPPTAGTPELKVYKK